MKELPWREILRLRLRTLRGFPGGDYGILAFEDLNDVLVGDLLEFREELAHGVEFSRDVED